MYLVYMHRPLQIEAAQMIPPRLLHVIKAVSAAIVCFDGTGLLMAGISSHQVFLVVNGILVLIYIYTHWPLPKTHLPGSVPQCNNESWPEREQTTLIHRVGSW